MSLVTVEPRRRCACCRAPCNRCPCRHCGSCSTSGGDPASCSCGRLAPSVIAEAILATVGGDEGRA